MGPSYFFLGFIEEKIRNTYNGPKPEVHLRYIDDIFGITQLSENDLKNWMNFVCNFHPSIQYTKDMSTTSVTFLDINIQIKNNKILTQIHYKKTDSHNYLRYDSFHPEPCKNSIPYCQLLRLRKLTTDDDQFEQDSNEMVSHFQKQGYPTGLIQQAKSKVGKKSQQSLLQPQLKATRHDHRIPFVTTYHPTIRKVFEVLKKNWPILSSSSSIFNTAPLLSLRRSPNLRQLLVRSRLTSDNEIPGTFPCDRARCVTCLHTSRITTLSCPNRDYTITSTFTCTSSNLVYAIQCMQCAKVYIGETGRRLGDRFAEHRRDVIAKRRSSPVAQHFGSTGHSLEDMSVMVLRQFTSDSSRKRGEMALIYHLGTQDPSGLNIDFSFNV